MIMRSKRLEDATYHHGYMGMGTCKPRSIMSIRDCKILPILMGIGDCKILPTITSLSDSKMSSGILYGRNLCMNRHSCPRNSGSPEA